METRSYRKNRNTTLRHGDVYCTPVGVEVLPRTDVRITLWRCVSQFCIGTHAVVNHAWCSLGARVPPSTEVRTLLQIVLSSCRR